VCTADCLHEQEWWILMHSSCERRLYKSSLYWALAAAYSLRNSEEWFGRWYVAVATGHDPDVYCITSSKRRETSLGGSRKHTTLWFPGGSSHYRYWSAILVTTAMTQHPPLLSSILPRLLPLPLFNEGLGVSRWKNCVIKDVCRKIGKIVELKMVKGTF